MEVYEKGPPIHPGYEWRLRVITNVALFAAGDRLVAHVRRSEGSAEILATLMTEDASIIRLSDTEIELLIAADLSREWRTRTVTLDVSRAWPEPKQALGFRLEIPIDLTVTRGLL